MSRAVGETMIVALAAGAQKKFDFDVFTGHQAMTGFIARTFGGENPVGSTPYNMAFAVAMTLFVMTFVLNVISMVIVRRFRNAY